MIGSDEGQLAAAYATHVNRVYGYLLARCGSVALAEDLTQTTFEHLARHLAKSEGVESSEAWLITVAKRRLIDYWRSQERQRSRFQQLHSIGMAAARAGSDMGSLGLGSSGMGGSEVENSVINTFDERIMRALQSLPPRQRAALALRYLDDASVSEVADVLETSYRSAESLLARARRGFSNAYSNPGQSEDEQSEYEQSEGKQGRSR